MAWLSNMRAGLGSWDMHAACQGFELAAQGRPSRRFLTPIPHADSPRLTQHWQSIGCQALCMCSTSRVSWQLHIRRRTLGGGGANQLGTPLVWAGLYALGAADSLPSPQLVHTTSLETLRAWVHGCGVCMVGQASETLMVHCSLQAPAPAPQPAATSAPPAAGTCVCVCVHLTQHSADMRGP